MARVKVVTDSTADIPRGIVEQLGIIVVPLSVHFGEKVYLDYVELTSANFYDLLRKSPDHPRTSQPSPGDFATVFEEATKDGSSVVAVLVSAAMSGTCQSAFLARDMVKNATVEIIDSRAASMAIGLAVIEGARAAKAGKSQADVVAVVNDVLARTKVFFVVDTLEYLARNGRIGKAQALLGNLLSVKPVLTLEDGQVASFEKVRGEKKVIPRLVEIMGESLEPSRKPAKVAIAHADCLERAEELKAAIEKAHHPAEITMSGLGAVVGTHVGPGTQALMWFQP